MEDDKVKGKKMMLLLLDKSVVQGTGARRLGKARNANVSRINQAERVGRQLRKFIFKISS